MGEFVTEGSAERFLALLTGKLGSNLLEGCVNLGTPEIRVESSKLLDLMRLLKLDSELSMELFLSVTAVDWLDNAKERFELVYHLLNPKKLIRLRVKSWISENNPSAPSVAELWAGADFMEREVYDMYGIKFTGHPDMRRILLYDEFVGYPLRKDYPVQAKQPRIPLRYPEVRNTAVEMRRSPLVSINPRQSAKRVGNS